MCGWVGKIAVFWGYGCLNDRHMDLNTLLDVRNVKGDNHTDSPSIVRCFIFTRALRAQTCFYEIRICIQLALNHVVLCGYGLTTLRHFQNL